MKMKPLLMSICGLLTALALHVNAQQSNPRLIIRSDDMGAFHSVNEACMDGFLNGVQTCVEVMVVTPWFPEAVKMLRENPGFDVGVHLTITSEWENFKWRPLTSCSSLTDENGYFYPMMSPNPAYPGQSIKENKWNVQEIEQEFRAQIELALKNIPQVSHLSGHMGSTGFDAEVVEIVKRLAAEYDLPSIDRVDAMKDYNFAYVGYDGPKKTSAEKESSFIRMLDKLEPGKNYLFLDHPAYNNDEMQTVGHIGYEDVAIDRQGVTDLLTSPGIKQAIEERGIELITYDNLAKALPRGTPQAEKMNPKAVTNFLQAIKNDKHDLHSLMIVRNGKVIAEHWLGDNTPNKPHILNSVSKTFTATAIGFAVTEGLLKVTDKVISFFPDKLPAEVTPYLKEMEIRDLLTMSAGHEKDPTASIRNAENSDWVKAFLAFPIKHKPGTEFVYNSMGTYMLSAIVQKVTGEKLINYLSPRLFRPLGITGAFWQESPQGINTGGWGLYVRTEDLAKLGQLYLQKGRWNGKQLLPEAWVEEATGFQIESLPAGAKKENLTIKPKDSDWLQGYGYQMWHSRHNSYRADGASGQFILVMPEKNAVVAMTANINDMQAVLNLVWKYLLPAMK